MLQFIFSEAKWTVLLILLPVGGVIVTPTVHVVVGVEVPIIVNSEEL